MPAIQFGNEAPEPIHPEPDIDPVQAYVHALYQQLDNAGLLHREQFGPEWVQLLQGLSDLGFAQGLIFAPRRPPGGDDDLRGAHQPEGESWSLMTAVTYSKEKQKRRNPNG